METLGLKEIMDIVGTMLPVIAGFVVWLFRLEGKAKEALLRAELLEKELSSTNSDLDKSVKELNRKLDSVVEDVSKINVLLAELKGEVKGIIGGKLKNGK